MSNFQGQGRGRGRGRGRGYGRGGFNNSESFGNKGNGGGVFSRLGSGEGQFNAQAGFGANNSQNFNSGSSFGNNNAVQNSNGPVQISIKGWRGGTESSLIKFLNRKTELQFPVENVNYKGDLMYAYVPSMSIAQALTKLNGIRFAGDAISIQIKDNPVKFGSGVAGKGNYRNAAPSPSFNSSTTIKDRLVALLQTRVDMQSNSLDLSSLSTDPIIISLGADPLHDGKIFKAILVVAAQLYPQVITINLANNSLHSLKPIADIGFNFPGLKNLSLMNNHISGYRDLDCLSEKGSTAPLSSLAELILIGNPLQKQAMATSPDGVAYVEQIQQRFPTISMLDMNAVIPKTQPGTSNHNSTNSLTPRKLPFPMKQTFSENPDVEGLTNGFLSGFFGLYDSNRNGLADVYDPNAQFSLMVDTTAPTSEFAQNNPESQKRVDFTTYMNISRNLSKIKSPQKRINNLIIGSPAIVSMLLQLPQTHHPIQDAQRFSYDSWQTTVPDSNSPPQPAIVVVVHGEFVEALSQNTISFDRTFILVPSAPNTPAAAAGWPCVIRHDKLVIRRYNGYSSWKPEPDNTGTSSAVPNMATSESATSAGLTADQQSMVQNLQSQTSMNVEWSIKCLADCGWNYTQALATFEQVRSNLPPEAFK